MFTLADIELPIVQAPMAGGTSTVELAAAVSGAGGLGFLAAGYAASTAVWDQVAELRGRTDRPFGVNIFAPAGEPAPAEAVARYARRLGLEDQLDRARHDDDGYLAKLELMIELRVPVVSFTFGCPTPAQIRGLREAGCRTWVTVTTPGEARIAIEAGADGLALQGVEAGGHRGSFDDRDPGEIGLLTLLRTVRGMTELPLVAAGGLFDGAGIAAAMVAGADAAQLGTAFMLCPEAGTAPAHRAAIREDRPTALTRAFTGRTARGIVNRFMLEHSADAPSAYPEIHHLTGPARRASREAGDADGFHLWAGQAHARAREMPAAELVAALATEARGALDDAPRDRFPARWSRRPLAP